MRPNPETDWIARIKLGDVLRARTGQLRVVRAVSQRMIPWYGIRTCVIFKINRCSWTGRCYTVYTGNDLRQMGYEPTGAREDLHTKMDRAIDREIRNSPSQPKLSCCDVHEVPA